MNKIRLICENSDTLYFETLNYAHNTGIQKVLFFIQKEEKILELIRYIKEKNLAVELIGVTFPSNEKMYSKKDDGVAEFIPPAALGNTIKDNLLSKGVKLISGTLPFEGIVIPGTSTNPYTIIKQTLGLISPGLQNAVQSVLMATDQGIVYPTEKVISMNTQISIEVSASNTRLLFHPIDGLKIHHLIATVE